VSVTGEIPWSCSTRKAHEKLSSIKYRKETIYIIPEEKADHYETKNRQKAEIPREILTGRKKKPP